MSFESADSSIGLINLDKNTSGKRSAGNLHATFDEAGAGNGRYNAPRQFSTLLVEEVSPVSRKLLRRRSFTLLELLIVISVFVILTSLLLPEINKALKMAQSIKCINNLKQYGTAFALYANDFKYFPTNILPDRWHNKAQDYLGNIKYQRLNCPVQKDLGIFQSYISTGNYTTFTINGITQSACNAINRNLIAYAASPSQFIFVADGKNVEFWGSTVGNGFGSYASVLRHQIGRSNCLFMDAHAISMQKDSIMKKQVEFTTSTATGWITY